MRWREELFQRIASESKLHGFDSFLGLPHDWSLEGHEGGYFSMGGRRLEVDDPRVRFFVDRSKRHFARLRVA